MEIFSTEYRDKLVAEHKLVTASILHIMEGPNYARFARNHTNDMVVATLTNLRSKKIELEAKIDVLTEFLS